MDFYSALWCVMPSRMQSGQIVRADFMHDLKMRLNYETLRDIQLYEDCKECQWGDSVCLEAPMF